MSPQAAGLHYWEWEGEGPPLVLLHGLNAHAMVWSGIAGRLAGATGRRLVAPDLPGHGYSAQDPGARCTLDEYAQRVLALIDQLGLESPGITGLSMGGRIALACAALRPEFFRAVVVGDMGASLTEEQQASLVKRMEIFPTSAGSPEEAREQLRANYPSLPPPAVEVWAGAGIARTETGWRWLADRQAIVKTARVWNQVGLDGNLGAERITCPALILRGEKSYINTPAQAAEIAARIPRAQLITLPGVGHHLSLEAPELFIQTVEGFFDRVGI